MSANYSPRRGQKLNWVCDVPAARALQSRMEQAPDPDPHGQAALMLCESLALTLIGQGVVTKAEIADAISGVIEIKREIAGTSESVLVSMTSINLLQAVARSISAAPEPHSHRIP
jgi:hypothetical protein